LNETLHDNAPDPTRQMNIEIRKAGIQEKPVLRNLVELYRYDSSEFDGADVGEHGLFVYRYFDHYWTEPGRHAFIVRVSGRLAGFAMVRAIGVDESEPIHGIAEFFIMRKYRRQGVGTTAARRILDMFPGGWRVAEEEANTPAQMFWRKVISGYTSGGFKEIRDDEWGGPQQEFRTERKEL
jgi:predicted acetyltransferase